jgi:hypothetical protein
MGIRTRAIVVCATTMLLLLDWAPQVLSRPVELPLGYQLGRSPGTESKPQSKLWYLDGSWWCVLADDAGNHIYELQAHQWIPQDYEDALLGDAADRADVLWDGTRLIALLFGPTSQLFEFSYDPDKRRYHRLDGFPVSLDIPASSETAVIEQDSHDHLWITWTAERQVRVVHSLADHRNWNFPGMLLRDEVSADDISTVVAFGNGSIGVLWSDQARDEFAFRMRHDADALDQWAPREYVHGGERIADDHLNTCTDDAGRIYVASKNGAHELSVHLRDVDGKWTTHANVLQGGHGTRPIVMASNADDKLYLLYTRWHEGLEIVASREAPLGGLDFGEAVPFLSLLGEKVRLTDVTGTKQSLPAGTLVAIAHAKKRAWWNGWGAGVSAGASRSSAWDLNISMVARATGAALALPFDAAQGHDAADVSPSANQVSLGGFWSNDMSEPTWVRGVSGAALRFNGWRSFVTVRPSSSLNPPASFTLEAWVRRFGVWDNHVVLCKGAPGKRSYQLRIDKSNRVEFLREVVGEERKHRVRSQATIEDSLWHHIACVVDLQQQESRLYLDGVQVATAPDSGTTVQTDDPLYIGARVYKNRLREWWSGEIDQVRLSHSALHEADFVPAVRFPAAGTAMFLSWSRPYLGPGQEVSYEVLRSLDGGEFVSLRQEPMMDTSLLDAPSNPGRVTYRVRMLQPLGPGPADQWMEWFPATTNGSAVAHHR